MCEEILGFPVIRVNEKASCDPPQFGLLGSPLKFNMDDWEIISKRVDGDIITYQLRLKDV